MNVLTEPVTKKVTTWMKSQSTIGEQEPYEWFLDEIKKDANEKGFLMGEAKGKAEGALVAAAAILRLVLAKRGFVLSPHIDERITSCTRDELLQQWLIRAIDAPTLGDVFSETA